MRGWNPWIIVAAFALALPMFAQCQQATAATIVSSPFSMGYGYVRFSAGVGAWNDSETATANTATTLGDFTFTPIVTGNMFSNAGPRFPNRVMTNGAGSDDGIGATGTFGLSITGTYTGALPPNTIATQINLNISELRIRGLAVSGVSLPGTDLAWNETTPGLLQSSPVQTLISVSAASSNYENINNWTILSWNPTDQLTDGLSQTRTFTLLSSNARGLEGLEIFGTVEVTFEIAIPEPGSGLLLGLGVIFSARRTVRRHRRLE